MNFTVFWYLTHTIIRYLPMTRKDDCSLPGSTVHGILQAGILEWITIPFCGDIPNSGIKPRSPALQADSLLSEPPGKPKKTGVGSLTLLQGNFPMQESELGLLHCRRVR